MSESSNEHAYNGDKLAEDTLYEDVDMVSVMRFLQAESVWIRNNPPKGIHPDSVEDVLAYLEGTAEGICDALVENEFPEG